MLYPTLKSFYYDYAMPLAHALHEIERRGLLVDEQRLAQLSSYIDTDLAKQLRVIQDETTPNVVVYKDDVPNKKVRGSYIVLNYGPDVVKLLKQCGLKVPVDRSTHRETSNEVALQRIFADTGHPVPKAMLRIRELTKVKGTYVSASLFNGVLYCSYVPIGTVGGRRSSRANFLGLGTNHQNLPKYSDLGKAYRKCVVARPGKIFVACDQKGAEDWIVNGIIADNGGGTRGLDELKKGVNRHRKLACMIFAKPEAECGKETMLYYLAKRTRHGGNYDMRGKTMSEALAREGKFFPEFICTTFLEKFHEAEPEIRSVFHNYVQAELSTRRELRTPIGRRRTFLSLRPRSDNSKTFRDGYSYIPQSTVGDNNGLAILFCETNEPGLVVADGHDATYVEVDDNLRSVKAATELLKASYDRELCFPNGTVVKIPQEYEMGYSLGTLITYEESEMEEAYISATKANKLDTVIH